LEIEAILPPLAERLVKLAKNLELVHRRVGGVSATIAPWRVVRVVW
jgi:hypothetical protein